MPEFHDPDNAVVSITSCQKGFSFGINTHPFAAPCDLADHDKMCAHVRKSLPPKTQKRFDKAEMVARTEALTRWEALRERWGVGTGEVCFVSVLGSLRLARVFFSTWSISEDMPFVAKMISFENQTDFLSRWRGVKFVPITPANVFQADLPNASAHERLALLEGASPLMKSLSVWPREQGAPVVCAGRGWKATSGAGYYETAQCAVEVLKSQGRVRCAGLVLKSDKISKVVSVSRNSQGWRIECRSSSDRRLEDPEHASLVVSLVKDFLNEFDPAPFVSEEASSFEADVPTRHKTFLKELMDQALPNAIRRAHDRRKVVVKKREKVAQLEGIENTLPDGVLMADKRLRRIGQVTPTANTRVLVGLGGFQEKKLRAQDLVGLTPVFTPEVLRTTPWHFFPRGVGSRERAALGVMAADVAQKHNIINIPFDWTAPRSLESGAVKVDAFGEEDWRGVMVYMPSPYPASFRVSAEGEMSVSVGRFKGEWKCFVYLKSVWLSAPSYKRQWVFDKDDWDVLKAGLDRHAEAVFEDRTGMDKALKEALTQARSYQDDTVEV